jgi:exosortase B
MAATSTSPTGLRGLSAALWPDGVDRVALAALAAGLLILYVPTFWSLSQEVWSTDEQGHGPIILAVSWWLLYQRRHAIAVLAPRPSVGLGASLLALGLVAYAFGRSQSVLLLEVSSQIVVVAALLLMFKGAHALRLVWFPLSFLLFMVPLPEGLVAALTGPLKAAVSMVASELLYGLGYPVGRSGVLLTIGQYQLLVADACAGLNSMFSLEALGLLYMNIMNYSSALRNVTLAALLIPISFAANVVRVVVLVLITFYFGDEAAQGFAHGFAGLVLFGVALALMLLVDRLLDVLFGRQPSGVSA